MQSSLLAVWKNAGETLGRKGVKGLWLLGHEEVPCGFGLRTGESGDTADGVRTKGGLPAKLGLLGRTGNYLIHRLIFLSLRYGKATGSGKAGKGCVCLWVY